MNQILETCFIPCLVTFTLYYELMITINYCHTILLQEKETLNVSLLCS